MPNNFCRTCGTQLSGSGPFCANCGAAVPEERGLPASPSLPAARGGQMTPAIPHPARRMAIGWWVALGMVVVAVGGIGWYLWNRDTRVDSIPEFQREMEKRGWESQDDEPDSFVAKSNYDLADNGFVQLIEYHDEETAEEAQRRRADEQSAAAPGFEEAEAGGSVAMFTTLIPEGSEYGERAGMGGVELQFDEYRFEAFGDRSEIDELVEDLGYLDSGHDRTDLMTKFREAVEEAGISTSADDGYSERSAYMDGEFRAEYRVFHTPEDAQANHDTTLEYLQSEDREFGTSEEGDVQVLWFITEWPDSEGDDITQYALRTYVGNVMLAVSGPVEDRAEIESVMEDLGY